MSDLIQAISRGCKGTLADGTVRYTIDIDPSYAASAAALFGMPGTALAVAALKDGTPDAVIKESVTVEKPKGGELAKWAGILCNDTEFWKWFAYDDEPIGSPEQAAEAIRFYCDIESRAALDHNTTAAHIFREQIMAPFHKWKESRA